MAGSALSRRLSECLGVALFALALMWLVALASYSVSDPVWFFNTGADLAPANFAGRVGAFTAELSFQLVGYGAWLIPLVLVIAGWNHFWCHTLDAAYTKLSGGRKSRVAARDGRARRPGGCCRKCARGGADACAKDLSDRGSRWRCRGCPEGGGVTSDAAAADQTASPARGTAIAAARSGQGSRRATEGHIHAAPAGAARRAQGRTED
ncbi:MAG: DNA translocase FtsK 4TM domain-containing protein [Acidobacteria bacterium]|nr:DNA translocase FtsK 4TM domain-containing protein [Acidobacteriota bacterium]